MRGSRLALCGESFYNPMLPSVIKDLEAKGLLTDSEGAAVFFSEVGKPPLIVRVVGVVLLVDMQVICACSMAGAGA